MGPTLVLIFFAVFVLALGKALLQRKLNPFGEVAWAGLPEELRGEIERVLPGFSHRRVRLTRKGDEARVEGDYQGDAMRIEADLDARGALVELEIDGPRGFRKQRIVAPEEVPAPVMREVERVLGADGARFERTRVLGGSAGGESLYEVKGRAGDWKWEIAVSGSGRLLEVEKEKRR